MSVLWHICIVRRDLPRGVLAAQLIHAAGESSLGRIPHGARKEGAEPRRALERSDRGYGARKEGAEPRRALERSDRGYCTHAVALAARDEQQLEAVARRLAYERIEHVTIREPDPPWCGALMAIGLVPVPRQTKPLEALRRLELLR